MRSHKRAARASASEPLRCASGPDRNGDGAQANRPRARAHASGVENQHGNSLVEVVTVVLILGLVLGAVFQGINSTRGALENTGNRLRNLDEARVLMAATSKDLRTAVRLQAGTSPFVSADKQSATFYANLDTTSAPKKVHIYVDGSSQLIEEVWNADAGSVAPNYTYTGTAHVRFVGRYLANTNAQPVFTYLDLNGAALSNYPLNATDLLAVRAVSINLIVKRATVAPLASTTLINRVRLPNLDYNAVAG